jgi:CRISPR-associated protein Cas2
MCEARETATAAMQQAILGLTGPVRFVLYSFVRCSLQEVIWSAAATRLPEELMEILVTYDVKTETAAGVRRLRRVAQVCARFGQRVQYSVFECIVDAAQLALLTHELTQEIDADEDSLRIYRLQEPRERYVQVLGRTLAHDQHEPLIF